MPKWSEAQEWESSWWGKCLNTYGEEEKQILYAKRMGLHFYHNKKSPYNIDMKGKDVIDIGGGPTSLLLKCENLGVAVVADPLVVPEWVHHRYGAAAIDFWQTPGEQLRGDDGLLGFFDEAWIYNCLQHTANPKRIIDNALGMAKLVRIFEWTNTRINEGHPHSFTKTLLDKWLGGDGKEETLKGQANCYGTCYYGIFVGKRLDS